MRRHVRDESYSPLWSERTRSICVRRCTITSARGGPDQLKLVDLPLPICGPDQVVIKIQAAGVGMWDVKVRQGRVRLEGQQFPLVLSCESAGTIEQVGARVTGLGVGTQVICATYQVRYRSRTLQDPQQMDKALRGALALLESIKGR